jgi:hypothetical protein
LSSYFISRLKDSVLVFNKKAYMKEYNARPEHKQNVREATKSRYWRLRNDPEFRRKKHEADHKYRLAHLDEKRQKDREYFYRNRDRILERFRSRIKFQGHTKSVPKNPRTGICSICGHIGKTDMHHNQYDPENILANTIEVCDGCHNRVHIRRKGVM